MRVEIVMEIDPGDETLEIPWASPEDARLRYVDLKAHPASIGQLEECRRFPPLGDFLRRINSPETLLQTAKCDAWETNDLTEDERADFQLPCKVGSYVDVFFDRPELNAALEHQTRLGEELRQALDSFRVQAQLEVCIRRCLFHPEERWGYYLTLFTHAYGVDHDEAAREWARAIEAEGEALGSIGSTQRRAASPSFRRRPGP
jgi:hypothetical protein